MSVIAVLSTYALAIFAVVVLIIVLSALKVLR